MYKIKSYIRGLPQIERFLNKVEPELFLRSVRGEQLKDYCWNWKAYISKKGYSTYYYDGRKMAGHIAAVLMSGRLIPESMEVDHICENRRCVNPEHLEVITHTENIRRSAAISNRAVKKGRQLGLAKRKDNLPECIRKVYRTHVLDRPYLLRMTIAKNTYKYYGYYATVELAVEARDRIRKELGLPPV